MKKRNCFLDVSEPCSDSLSRCASSPGRYSLSSRSSLDRFPSYSGGDKIRATRSLSIPLRIEDDVKNKTKTGRQLHQDESNKNFRHVNQSSVNEVEGKKKPDKSGTVSLKLVSRGTSPTQPNASTSRRGDSCKIFEKEVRLQKTETKDEEVQVDRDDSRLSRFSGHTRISPWASYLDRYNPSPTGSRNYIPVSRNYGYSSPNSSRSDSLKTSSISGHKVSDSDKLKGRKSSDSSSSNSKANSISNSNINSNSNSSFISNSISNSNFLTPKSSESKKSKSKNSQDESEMNPSEGKSVSSKKSESWNGESERSSNARANCNSSTYDENGVPKGQGKDLRKDFQQRSESASSKSKSISQSNSSKNLARQMTRTDSSESSAVIVPTGKLKSSSTSSMTNHSAKIKTMSPSPPSPGKISSSSGTSVSSRQCNSSDMRGKPPVPKNEVAMKNVTQGRYVNKDFRKSVLNMENGDPARSQKSLKKCQRSMSTSSQDSETNSEAPQGISSSSSKSKTLTENSRGKSSEDKLLKKNSISEASCESSSDSSGSEEDVHQKSSSRKERRASESPFHDGKNHMSTGSSRTSVLASSADELSLTMDKPPRHPNGSRSKHERSGKTEEAKCFLMRALAPVTGLFKGKQSDSGEIRADGWVHSDSDSTKKSSHNLTSQPSSQNLKNLNSNSEKNLPKSRSNSRLKHQNSGERPWWMDPNSENVPEGIERNSVGNEDNSQETTISTSLPDDGKKNFVENSIDIFFNEVTED